MPAPQRILIVRLTAIGDVIHGLPSLCALRNAFPDAHISWVVEGAGAQLLEGHPALDEVIRAPRRWYRSWGETRRLRKTLRQRRFDTAVDLQCLTKSALAAWLSGAPRRLGVAGRNGREFSRALNNVRTLVRARHVIDQYLGILTPLGINNPKVEFRLPESAADAAFADRLLAEGGLESGRFLVMNPGAGWTSKQWPPERYGELAARLRRSHGVPTVVAWAGDQERRLAQTIVDASGAAARLAPDTSLTQLAALERRATLFVGSDTGPMHLAVAVGTPAVSLHGPSRASWCGAYGEHNQRIQVELDEGPQRKRPGADDYAMRAISVDLVAERCDAMLARLLSAGRSTTGDAA
ncbi:glycosyltransferase family 9 protein [Posidoniimonas polymericola]|uniref:glycosyltransferase family 9 protein n=1 Tax=Posidoniimonas polymericola TaxID=2528002 RepID=UPI0018D37119|nr:glycosyltransferase family 9 protein [Posidoniimonas polymericola]